MLRKGVFSILLLLLWFSIDVVADDFYFGANMNQVKRFKNIATSPAGGEADSIKNYLGFNSLMWLAPKSDTLEMIGTDKGFFTFPTMFRADDSDTREAWHVSWNAYYAVVEAEDNVEIGFYSTESQSGDIVYGPTDSPGTPVIFLDSLEHFIIGDTALGEFSHSLKIDYDTSCDALDPTDTVAYLVLHNTDKTASYGYALVDSFFITKADLAEFVNLATFTRLDDDRVRYKVQIGTYQRCTFGVDSYKFYNDKGYAIVEQGLYYDKISQFAADNSEDGNVKYWLLHDEPKFGQWLPHRVGNDSLEIRNTSLGAAVFSYLLGQGYPREFIGRADPEILLCDIYPLKGGQICTTFTTTICYNNGIPDTTSSTFKAIEGDKTGYTGSDSAGNGLQYVLDNYYIEFLDSLYAAASDSGVPLWMIPQAFGQAYKSYDSTEVSYPAECDSQKVIIDCDCNNDEWFIWRQPTRSELSAMTFMAMCYDIKGLLYWRYDSWDEYNAKTDGITEYDGDGYCKPGSLWVYLEKYISPYVKAYGEIYADASLGFELDRTYPVNETANPPSGALISSITSWSESTNPDSGWLQVGEFHDDSSAQYVMLVNRACNIDENTLAPDINIVVHFDTAAFDSSSLYVINLADIAYYNADSSRWEAISTTTYTSVMPDGTIPFTTVLGPGEGRLFKIVASDQ